MEFENPQKNIDKSLKKYEIVKNSFGTWENFLMETKKALREVEGKEEFKPGSKAFAKYLFGSHFDQVEYALCMQAINEAVAEIRKNESEGRSTNSTNNDNANNSDDNLIEIERFEQNKILRGAYGREQKRIGEAHMLGIDEDEI